MTSNTLYKDYFVPTQSNFIPSKTIILGKYNFINCLPLNLPLEDIPEKIIQPVFGVPNVINKLLYDGIINIGPISSYDYLKNKEKYALLKDISISSQKTVGSVILFSNIPLEDLANKTIAVAHTSSTSIRLLNLLIKIKTKQSAKLVTHYYEQGLQSLLNLFDAILYIGDPALNATYKENNNNNIIIYDLAEEWYKITNMPMVFGIWVAYKDWAVKNPEALEFINHCLSKSKELSFNLLFNDLIENASRSVNLPNEILVNYYKNQLSYDFSDIQKQALEQFHCQLSENDLL
ncbi:MAG: menaquinone biosynthesis protein [Cyanobacteriota bacterium]